MLPIWSNNVFFNAQEEAYLKREKESVSDMLPGYFHDFWNYFDWIVYLLNFTVLVSIVHYILTLTTRNFIL